MLTWLEQRTGFVSMTKDFLTEDIPGGASYWYVFGSATLFAMILQIATGIFLTFFYAPSAATAWESTDAMYHNGFQHFVLSLHSWGASAMIALVALHMLQVIIFGAYKSPRELQWVVGVLLFIVTLVLGLTGYLLPWDMNAYFASQVAINISGTAPVLGPFVQQFLQDGPTMGTLTINRFFGVHVWLMPIALLGLVGAHLAIFRHNGPAGPTTDDRRGLKIGRFYPDQVFMDTVVSFFVFFIIIMLAIFAPPGLDAKADPTNAQFVPYPAWYFLSLFGLLAIMPPSLELVGTIVIPTLAIIALILLPWLVPLVVGGIVWRWLFDQTNGIIDQVLSGLHLAPAHFGWLTTPGWSLSPFLRRSAWLIMTKPPLRMAGWWQPWQCCWKTGRTSR